MSKLLTLLFAAFVLLVTAWMYYDTWQRLR